MRRMLHATLIAVVLALAMTITAGSAAADDVIDLQGATVTLPADATTVVQFPFAPVGAAPPAGYAVSVARILRDGRPVPAPVLGAVRASIAPAVPAVVLTVDVDKLDRAGNYAVTIAVTAAARRELVDLQLMRSGATLQVPATIEVRRTMLLNDLVDQCLGLCSDAMPELRLIGGPDTRVTALAVYPLGGPTPPVGIQMFDGAAPVPLPVPLTDGGSLRIHYDLPAARDSRPGIETTPLRITSPQLAAEIPVDVRVTTVRTPVLIVVISSIGLLLGWLVRFGLVRVRRWGALRTDALALADRIDDLLAGTVDAPFRKSVEVQRDRLRSTSWWVDPKVGQEKLDAVAAEVNAACDDLRTRLVDADQKRRALASALRPPWAVEGVLAERLAAAVVTLDEVERFLDADDADGAIHDLDDLDRRVKNDIVPEARRVIDRNATAAQAILDVPGLVGQKALQTAVPRLRATAGLAVPAGDVPLADVLGAAHQSTAEAQACARELDAGVVRLVKQSGENQQVTTSAAQVRKGLQGPDPLQSAAALLPNLLAAADDQLLGLGEADTSVGVPVALPSAEPPIQRWFAARRIGGRLATVAAATLGWTAEVVRFLLMLSVLAVVSYGVFGPDWSGTTSQMFAVFSWAFALDVGVAAIQSALPASPLSGTASTAKTLPAAGTRAAPGAPSATGDVAAGGTAAAPSAPSAPVGARAGGPTGPAAAAGTGGAADATRPTGPHK